jgi:transposase
MSRTLARFGPTNTAVDVAAVDEDTALADEVVPGQAGDVPRLVPLLDRTLGRVAVIDEVVGDKGFDGERLREQCLERDANPNIPLKSNRDPGRWAFDADGYRERLFGKAKQFRRVATRYEKLKVTYLGLLHLILGFIRLRKRINVNTP